jgi:hypothetical protein
MGLKYIPSSNLLFIKEIFCVLFLYTEKLLDKGKEKAPFSGA